MPVQNIFNMSSNSINHHYLSSDFTYPKIKIDTVSKKSPKKLKTDIDRGQCEEEIKEELLENSSYELVIEDEHISDR